MNGVVAMSRTKFTGAGQGKVDAAVVSKGTKRMVAGRTRVVFDRPLYSPMLFKLEFKVAPWLPTMATDGKSLMFNPKFAVDLDLDHLMFAILHETMHCVFRHPARRGTRDAEIWNIAGDISINNILIYEEKLKHPNWVLHDRKYMGWTTEAIYDELIKDRESSKKKYKVQCPCVQKDPTASSGGGGSQDGDEDGKGSSDGQGGADDPMARDPRGWADVEWSKDVDEEWKQAAVAAQQYAKMRGTTPGWLNTLIDEIVEPPVPIEAILQHIVGTIQSDETSWKNPNRRFVSRGLHLPTSLKDKKDGVIIIDTSGSVDDETAKDFMGMALRAVRSKGINELRVIQCDTRVVDDVRCKDVSTLKFHIKREGLKGRGGTSFKPPFALLDKDGFGKVSFCIYLTDLEGDFPEKLPRFPMFWISVEEHIAPFGKTYYWDKAGNKVKPMRKGN